MTTPTSPRLGPLKKHEELVDATQRLADASVIAIAQLLAVWMYRDAWRASTTTATALGIVTFMLAGEFGGLYRPWRTESLAREARICSWLGRRFRSAWQHSPSSPRRRRATREAPRCCGLPWRPSCSRIVRAVVRYALRYLRATGMNQRRVAILGSTDDAQQLAMALAESPWLGLKLIGIYDDRKQDRRYRIDREDCHVLGDFDNMIWDARAGRIDTIYVALPMSARHRNEELFRALSDTTVAVYMVAGLFNYNLMRARWSNVGGIPVVSIHESALDGSAALLKRIEDPSLAA